VQCLEERNECSRLRGVQVPPISRHIASALDYLADQLILREPYGDSIQLRPPLAADAAQGVAVVALLHLKNKRPLPL
jgi:hypothetical protein